MNLYLAIRAHRESAKLWIGMTTMYRRNSRRTFTESFAKQLGKLSINHFRTLIAAMAIAGLICGDFHIIFSTE